MLMKCGFLKGYGCVFCDLCFYLNKQLKDTYIISICQELGHNIEECKDNELKEKQIENTCVQTFETTKARKLIDEEVV